MFLFKARQKIGAPSTSSDTTGYDQAASKCEYDANCNSYAWACPQGNCVCPAANPNCANKFPLTAVQYSYYAQGSDNLVANPTSDVFVKQGMKSRALGSTVVINA